MRNSGRKTEPCTAGVFCHASKTVRGTGYIRVLFGLSALVILAATSLPDSTFATGATIGVVCAVLIQGAVTVAVSQLIVQRMDAGVTSVALDCILTVAAVALLVGGWTQLDRNLSHVILAAVAVAVVCAIVIATVKNSVPARAAE